MNALKLVAVAAVAAMALGASSTGNIADNTYGSPKAPVLIEVFSDFQCPGCKAFHDAEFQRIMKDYVVPGKVYLIYRYFPLVGHPYGRPTAEYVAAAARVQRYQKVADAMFQQQAVIEKLGNVEAVAASVLTPTELQTVKSLLKSPEVQKEIDTDLTEGKAIPLQFTPTLLITAHGKSESIHGPINYDLLKQYLDSLLK
jgi:protein-disulfide isomerase